MTADTVARPLRECVTAPRNSVVPVVLHSAHKGLRLSPQSHPSHSKTASFSRWTHA
jgi:hypothetical protein